MKFRTDFVTNSSSSSFVFAFKDDADWGEFAEYCKEFGYEDVKALLSRSKEMAAKDADEARKKASELLDWSFVYEERRRLIEENVPPQGDDEEFTDYLRREDAYTDSEGYKKAISDYLASNKQYQDKRKQFDEAGIVFSDMIWDSNGGLLEWAIRNGFFTSEFWKWCLVDWPVG